MARFDPHQSYLLQPHPKRWKLQTILGIIVLGSAAVGIAWLEMEESFLQASHFAEQAKASTWIVEPGADKDIWLPSAGPYDQRLFQVAIYRCLL